MATGLVGRAAQIAQLDAELPLAASGEVRVVLLLGEAGVGNTSGAGVRGAQARPRGRALGSRIPTGQGRVVWSLVLLQGLATVLSNLAAHAPAETCEGHNAAERRDPDGLTFAAHASG
jgi:hypothetical protein